MSVSKKIVNVINNIPIKVEESLCSHFRTSKSDCTLCIDICPINAVHISNDKVEITNKCINCGACFSACPNNVFRITDEKDDSKIITTLRETFKKKKKIFSISCIRGYEKADLTLPCLGRLTEVLLLEPIRMGASSIEILQPSCQECHLAKASTQVDKIIKRTLYLYEMVGVDKDRLFKKEVPLQDSIKKPEKAVSRREFLSTIKTKTLGIAAASLPEIEDKAKEKAEIFREILQQRPENLKRSLLLKSLRGFPLVKTVIVPSGDAILAEIEITSECKGCVTCATLCPTGAIIQKETEDYFYLGFKPYLCINCKMCLKVCMYNAIKIKNEVSLNLLLERQEITIFEAKKKTCRVCQTTFISADSEFCPLCINISRRQKNLVQNLMIKEEELL